MAFFGNFFQIATFTNALVDSLFVFHHFFQNAGRFGFLGFHCAICFIFHNAKVIYKLHLCKYFAGKTKNAPSFSGRI